jgi:YD repeat-containing protein
MKKLLLVVLAFVMAYSSNAQDVNYYPDDFLQRVNSSVIASGSGSYGSSANDILPATMHDRWNDVVASGGSPTGYSFKSVRDYIKVGINHDTSVHVAAYKYAVTLLVNCFTPASPGPTPASSFSITLNLSYNPDSLNSYNDLSIYKFSNYQKIQVSVTNIQDISGTPTTVARTSLARNFYIQSDIIVERYDNILSPMTLVTGSAFSSNSLNVSWAWVNSSSYCHLSSVPGSSIMSFKPALYEIEWTYVDDYSYNFSTGTSSYTFATAGTVNYDFRKNSTRVQTNNLNYTIPVIYEHGAIIYRIRYLRPDPTTGYKTISYSAWSLPDYGSKTISDPCFDAWGYYNSTPYANDSLNWQYTINFAEEGKFKHVINYFDGTLKERQTQTKINTDVNNIVVLDKIYDYEGRPSIQTLPTPVVQSNLGYRKDIAINAKTGKPYEAADFDYMGCSLPDSLPPLSSTAQANIYYSPLNPDKSGMQRFVPDAKGYPFSETLYYPDNSNKVLWQGGVGNTQQLWKNHITRYEYANAQQVDVDKLMGSEAGYYNFYPKQIVTDPNGQTSYSIFNSSGKVVVSGLIGDPDTVHGPIDTLTNYVRGDTTCANMLADITQQKLSDKLRAENTFYADKAGSNHLQYSVSIPAFATGCGGKYLWAKGKYQVTISTDCGVPVMKLSDSVGKDSTLSTNTAEYVKSAPKDTALPKAKYLLTKDLIFDKYAITADVQNFVRSQEPTCYHDSSYFIRRTVDSSIFPCRDSGMLSECDMKKREMIRELYPGGKYGTYNKDGNGFFASGAPNSIFTKSLIFTYDSPPYYDSDYRYKSPCVSLPSSVIYGGRTYTGLATLPVDTFIMIFNDAIANALLPLHPEYCALQNCDDGTFEKTLNSLITYQQAQTANMFILDTIIHHDPIYIDAPAGSKTTVYNSLAHLKSIPSEKIDQLTLENVYCATGNSLEQIHCQAYLYKYEIQNMIFINGDVEQQYFQNLKTAYIANRTVLLQEKNNSRDTTCSTCSQYGYGGGTTLHPLMMHLTGTPVFNSVLDANGNLNSSSLPGWMVHLFNSADSGTLTSTTPPIELSDSMTAYSSSILNGQIDGIMERLANCTLVPSYLSTIRANLVTACGSCTDITPAMVSSAITSFGISQNDLCNPFVAVYNNLDPSIGQAHNYICGKPYIYTGMQSFLNRSGVMTAIRDAASHTAYSFVLSPSTNSFEKQIYQYWNDSNITATGYINSITSTYGTSSGTTAFIDLRLKPSYATTDSFDIYIKPELTSYQDLVSPTTTYNVTQGICINDDSLASTSGYATKNTAVFSADATVSSTVYHGKYLLWSRKINFMTEAYTNTIANCITCLDIKNAVNNFITDAATYGYDIHYNHPLFQNVLTNYLNYTLKKDYTFDDYNKLMNGCALSDKIVFPKYYTYMETVSANDGLANNIISTFNSLTSRNLFQTRLKIGTQTIMLMDFNMLPKDSLLYYYNLLINNIGANGGYYSKVNDSSYVFCKTSLCVDTFNKLASAGSVSSSSIQIQENGTYVNYTMYKVSSASGTAMAHSKTDSIIQTFTQGCPGSQAIYSSQLLRSDDYATTDKQNYLNYVYALNPATHSDLIDSISAANLQKRLAGMSSKTTSYDDPYCSAKKTDFYYYTANQSSYYGYSFMYNNIITPVMTFMGSSKIFPDNLSTSVSSSLKVYKKVNGYYWYRYFDANNHLYNVYINPPANPGVAMSSFHLDSMRVGPGKDSIRSLVAYVSTATGVNVYACKGYTDFTIGYSKQLQNVILQSDPTNLCTDTLDCEHSTLIAAIFTGDLKYKQYFDSVTNSMATQMIAFYINNAIDTLTLCTGEQKYQYTLYYYDRAGNLERTVPPAGVTPLASSALPTVASSRNSNTIVSAAIPAHTKVSRYYYDAQNKLIEQQTPDGGITYFFYDAAGRLVFSQNSKQRPNGLYSYTLYDKQGRPFETGEAKLGCTQTSSGSLFDTTHCSFTINGVTTSSIHPPYVAHCQNDQLYPMDSITKYVLKARRNDVVRIIYDTAITNLSIIAGANLDAQENLRKRVSAICYNPTMYSSVWPTSSLFSIYYSYDMVGNVKTVSYDYARLSNLNQRYKRVDYDFDMLSGKINMLSYNRNRKDQFYQKYTYDADNRITSASTSNDGIIWNTDAQYNYYKHGPLAQEKIGNQQIQSIEYAYTIQGWLKAINGDLLRPDKEMGGNGQSGDLTYARDVVAHALDYFSNDYSAIDATAIVTNFGAPAKSLYNGNIVRQTTSIGGLGSMQRSYRYDQLQRLKLASNATVNESTLAVTPSQLYASNYTYDADGNILTLGRKDTLGNQLDNLAYSYATGNNMLTKVNETAAATSGTDIQPGQPTGNYQYDKIGNLITDQQGHIKIDWTPYGKVRTITDTVSGVTTYFTYDGKGNRVFKEAVKRISSTSEDHQGEYYVYDATGNLLATYKVRNSYGPLKLVAAVDGAVSSHGLSGFLTGTVIPIAASFSPTFQSNAIANNSTWVSTQTDAMPVSYYLSRDGDLMNRMLFSTDTYLDPLRTYDNENSGATYANALTAANMNATQVLMDILNVPAPPGEQPAESNHLLQYFDMNMPPNLTPQVWESFGVPYTPFNPVVNANNLQTAMNQQHFQPVLAQQMLNTMNNAIAQGGGDQTPVVNFYKAAVNDNAIFDSYQLRGQGSPFEFDLTGVLNNFGDRGVLTGFFDQWTDARTYLNQNTSIDERYGYVYGDDPGTQLSTYISNVGTSDIDIAIASAPEFTGVGYFKLAYADATIGPYLGPAMLALGDDADTISLASHEIYGSSRLGEQRYDTVAYRQTYNIDTSHHPIKYLDTARTWYSYNYDDLVDASSKNPYGHTDLSNINVARILGKRYYEIDDHLGNVLATVLDRKTGHRVGGTAPSYDYWLADLASVSDYYPGGMLMPKRYKQAGDTTEYRFAYNGMLKDNDVYGMQNLNSALYGQFDTRLMRRWNTDPINKPWESSYATFSDNPIIYCDPLGNTASDPQEHTVKKGETLSGIAKKVGVRVKDLAKLNQLSDPNKLKVGQILQINPEVNFSHDPYTAYNNPNNPKGTEVSLDDPADIAADFAAGTGPENSLITSGKALDQVKNLPSVQALFNEGWKALNADGKLTPGEVFKGSFSIGKIYGENGKRIITQSIKDVFTKKPGDNTFFQAENVLGSFAFSMRVNSSGNLTITISDWKTISSATDGNIKSANNSRLPDMVIIPGMEPVSFGNWGTTTFQRYIWDVLVINKPKN